MFTASTRVDWANIHERMRQSQLGLEKGLADDPRHIQRVYRLRAARLARPAVPSNAETGFSVLVFAINEERYAIELPRIAEIIAHPNITPLPGSPPELCGIINVRGEIRPVWETALLLGLADQYDRPPGPVVLLRRANRPAGLRVDEVRKIRDLQPGECQTLSQPSPFVKPITADMVTLLEPDALLKEELSI